MYEGRGGVGFVAADGFGVDVGRCGGAADEGEFVGAVGFEPAVGNVSKRGGVGRRKVL